MIIKDTDSLYMRRRKFKRILMRQALVATVLLFLLAMVVGAAFANETLRTGMWKGLNGHSVSGKVSLISDGEHWKVMLEDDFFFDGAPDPKIALGSNGKHDPATLLEVLISNKGAQDYTFPTSVDGSKYGEVYIWCETFSVGLGIADLN